MIPECKAVIGASANSLVIDSTGSYTLAVSFGGIQSPASAAIVVDVNPLPDVPAISVSGDSLISSADSGNTWYQDSSLMPSGDSSQYFVPAAAGSYRVRVTIHGCSSGFSAPYAYSPAADSIPRQKIQVTPNPTVDIAVVTFASSSSSSAAGPAFVQVYDRYGRQVIFLLEVNNGVRVDL